MNKTCLAGGGLDGQSTPCFINPLHLSLSAPCWLVVYSSSIHSGSFSDWLMGTVEDQHPVFCSLTSSLLARGPDRLSRLKLPNPASSPPSVSAHNPFLLAPNRRRSAGVLMQCCQPINDPPRHLQREFCSTPPPPHTHSVAV